MSSLQKIHLSACLLCLLCFPFRSKATVLYHQEPAKITVTGVVLDRATQAVIPYASVGLVEESIGTVTNEEGAFSLSLSGSQPGKLIRVSAIGMKVVVQQEM